MANEIAAVGRGLKSFGMRISKSISWRPILTVVSLAVLMTGCPGRPTGQETEASIQMERTACYGKCPVYTLSIEPNGKVTFEGKQFTETLGKVESKLEDGKMAQLIAAIDKADYFALNSSYVDESDGCPITATDSPSVNLKIRLGSYENSTRHYYGCLEKGDGYHPYPAGLTELEKRIDEIVGTSRWIGK